MKKLTVFLAILLNLAYSQNSWAALPPVNKAAPSAFTQEMKSFLKHSPSKRPMLYKTYGVRGKAALAEIAFEKTENLETRWDALVTLGRLDPKYAQVHLDKALVSSDWFMRNAALIVVSYGERNWAVKQARLALHDPALVVRTAAVQALAEMRAIEAKTTLWEKMNSSENFKRGESLWIRPIIANTLAVMADKKDQASFEALLKDKDPQVKNIAMATLNKIK
jgi:HEAT repeat protein